VALAGEAVALHGVREDHRRPAVVDGREGVAQGGKVVVEIMPGQGSNTGSTRNGITTDNYATWGGSYRFVG